MTKHILEIRQTIVAYKEIEAETVEDTIEIAKSLDLRNSTYDNEIAKGLTETVVWLPELLSK